MGKASPSLPTAPPTQDFGLDSVGSFALAVSAYLIFQGISAGNLGLTIAGLIALVLGVYLAREKYTLRRKREEELKVEELRQQLARKYKVLRVPRNDFHSLEKPMQDGYDLVGESANNFFLRFARGGHFEVLPVPIANETDIETYFSEGFEYVTRIGDIFVMRRQVHPQ